MLRKKFSYFAKSSAALLCTAAVLMAGMPLGAGAASLSATTTDYLNLRQGAGTNTRVLLTLSKNVPVSVLDNSNGQWAKVCTSSGKVGYCFKQYLNFSGSSSSSSSSQLTAVTTDVLNMRTGPSTGYGIVSILQNRTSLKVLDNSNSQWAKVQASNGRQGWCCKDYLKISAVPAATPKPSPSAPKATGLTATTTDYLNLRTGAGTGYRVIVTLACGTSASVLDNSNSGWVKVRTSSGTEGWCSRQYLKISGGSSTASKPKPSSSTGSKPGTNTGSSSAGNITGAVVTADVLRLRQGASTSTRVLDGLSYGSKLKVLSAPQNGWVKVQTSSGKVGYVSAQYVKLTYSSGGQQSNTTGGNTQSKPKPVPSALTGAVVTADVLRLREGPSTSTSVLGSLPNGTSLKALGTPQNGWLKVQTSGGKVGYVSVQYVKLTYGSGSQQSGTTGGNTNPKPASPVLTGASVTADILRLREGPSTSTRVLGSLPNGTYLKALSTPQNGWLKVQTSGGKVGYVSAEYVRLLYNGSTGGSTSGNLSIAVSSASVPQGKTIWLKPSVSASWSSSNTSVAKAVNGYVYALSPGTATITAASGSSKVSCAVKVTAAEPVRTAYAAPNIAAPGQEITLTAVTDASRTGVQFSVSTGSGTKIVKANFCRTETTNGIPTKVWTAVVSFPTSGVYSYTAYSAKGGAYSSEGFTSDVMVATQGSETVTTSEQRRASDKILRLIANWEGYSPEVYADTLTYSNVPTIGYGCTLGAGNIFYDNLSQTEAWSQMVNNVNHSSYTTELNRMVANNHFLMNQNQADALISFAYNVGAGYFNGSTEMDFRRIMKNAVVPPNISGSGLAATVTYDASMRSNHELSAEALCRVTPGMRVTVTDTYFPKPKDGWYQIRLSNGSTGWINSGYVNFDASGSMKHDLNYTNAYAFGTELILWNQAGGKFYTGLFYRRLAEANIYNYGDYSATRSNQYNYTYPPSAADLD